ncbi:hypothetical protein [Treponema sp.]|uniref:hypothetical protein n=1 Tax=Treponema sp. TaxID=166 RepID=UPI00388D487F
MKKLIFCILAILMFFSFSLAGMSNSGLKKKSKTITGSPVYLGNAPFEKLAIKVAPKDGNPEVYLQIEFPEDSELTEKEISALQGYKVNFFGYIENRPGVYTNQIFVLTGYKK